MKKNVLLIGLFLSLQVSLYAQTYYINGTTDASLGNKPLIHSNELKIGNSTSATERAKSMIKIGDGSYIQIGEWEADDVLSFKASRYNFTDGKVGIGGSQAQFPLDILNTSPNATKAVLARLPEGGPLTLELKLMTPNLLIAKCFLLSRCFITNSMRLLIFGAEEE
jgi:hypothetical protein